MKQAVTALMNEEPRWLDRAQVATRAFVMAVRGVVTFASCTFPPRPVLRGRGVSIQNRQHIEIGAGSVLEDYVLLQGRTTDGVIIGRNVSVGRGAQIRPTGLYGRPAGRGLRVGDNANIGIGAYLGCSEMIDIGERVLMGPGVRIFTEWHISDDPDLPIKDQGVAAKPVVIEPDCWIGSGVTILPGVTIGAGSTIAAGSIVNRDVPAGALAAGIPATVKRQQGDASST